MLLLQLIVINVSGCAGAVLSHYPPNNDGEDLGNANYLDCGVIDPPTTSRQAMASGLWKL